MNRLLKAIQKVAATPTSLSEFINKKAEEQNLVVQTHASENTSPSSKKSPGMEQKKTGYGKSPDNPGTDDEVTKGEETGKVSTRSAGKNETTEGSGLPDVSIGAEQHSQKAAALKTELDKIAIRERLRTLANS